MTKLDEFSVSEIAEVLDLMTAAIEEGDRWFTIKPIVNVQRIRIALLEWLQENNLS